MPLQPSPLQKHRLAHRPPLPELLQADAFSLSRGEPTSAVSDAEEVAKCFPKTYGAPIVQIAPAGGARPPRGVRVGVILSGGQAPGGHNVIAGLFDRLQRCEPAGELIGFKMGPDGLIKGDSMVVTKELMDRYRNQGGFDMLGSSRTKIETPEQFASVERVAAELKLDGIVVIGGDDSNTNAAVLAEHFRQRDLPITVVGCPKTIDGDLRGNGIETPFGFDSACRVYSELVGNIECDCLSARKYWHFIRVMGRSASHIAAEVALQTHPTMFIIGEEVQQKAMTLEQLRKQVADVVERRAGEGRYYGVVVVPEGLVEFLPELSALLQKLSSELAHRTTDGTLPAKVTPEYVEKEILADTEYLQSFRALPREIQEQLLLDRDPHGNIQVSRIETEKLIVALVADELERRGVQKQVRFSPLCHFFGYEGRCVMPTNFDSNYCYALGTVAAILVASGETGMMACVKNLHRPVAEWIPQGLPITSLFNMELRNGKMKPVIQKALVELDGPVFRYLDSVREQWAKDDCFASPGPIQYDGPCADLTSITLRLNAGETLA